MSRLLVLVLVSALAACGDPDAPEEEAGEDLSGQALMACVGGAVDEPIARLDSALAAGPIPDGYAVRAGCLRTRYVRDSLRADLLAAYEDLDRALAEPASDRISPASLWSQRAFVLLALSPDSLRPALAAFDRAVDSDPDARTYRLDRSTARAMAGDTTGALADLAALDAMAASDSSLAATLVQRRAALGAE